MKIIRDSLARALLVLAIAVLCLSFPFIVLCELLEKASYLIASKKGQTL